MIGLALVYKNLDLYEIVNANLSAPCETGYDQARTDDNIIEVLKMLELALYSAVVSQNIDIVDTIIRFSKKKTYLIGVTNQVCIHVLKARLDS